ncbi:MAG: hypothetical protein JWM42_3812 [Burkholderia sp.]|nr:hypothetical protein [Burkholderia sp.]
MTTVETPFEVVRATRRGRLLLSLMFAVAIAVLALFQFFVLPFINSSLAMNPSPQSIATLKYLFAGFAALAVLPSIAMIVIGRRILRCGQSPLPGAWVWRDTRVKRGRDATRIGWTCIVSGALSCLICIGAVAYIWATFDKMIPAEQLRPGVILLQPESSSK